MTKETYEQAQRLKGQIIHISECLELLNSRDYSLDPPIRQSGFSLFYHDRREISLNEGEAVCIKNALEKEKELLEKYFDML